MFISKIPLMAFMHNQARIITPNIRKNASTFTVLRKNCHRHLSTDPNFKHQNVEVKDSTGSGKTNAPPRPILGSISQDKKIAKAIPNVDDLTNWTAVYRCDQITSARLVQRFKIGQTIFTVLLVAPLTAAGFAYQIVEVESVYFALGGSVLASVMLYVVGNFFSRLIGFIYVHNEENPIKTVRVAHLDFWGGRKDEYIPVEDFIPFSDYVEHYGTAYLKVKRYTDEDPKEEFNITLKYGTILLEDEFQLIFGGSGPPSSLAKS